jgi:hypothetical protein
LFCFWTRPQKEEACPLRLLMAKIVTVYGTVTVFSWYDYNQSEFTFFGWWAILHSIKGILGKTALLNRHFFPESHRVLILDECWKSNICEVNSWVNVYNTCSNNVICV